MSILSLEFLFFVAVSLAAYYLMPSRYRWLVLLSGSLLFLFLAGWQSLIHLSVVAFLTWQGGLALKHFGKQEKAQEDGRKAVIWRRRRKELLGVLLTLDLGAMIFIKYEPGVASWLNGLTEGNITFPVWELAIPLGLSYFTFQSAGLLIDIYRGKAEAQANPLRVWLFMGYFPQLIQGPISAWKELGEQLENSRRLEPERITAGFSLMLWGYFKKMVIADRLAATTEVLFQEPGTLPGCLIVFFIVLFAIRLYADFSGGMDVVLGISGMFGIELPENFRRPFFSQSVAEYWRRWHITLGAWFRSYVLYPLTTSEAALSLARRGGKWFGKKIGRLLPTAFSAFLIFLLIGLWHTASWNSLIYGAYFGVLMAGSVLLEPLWKKINRKLHLKEKRWIRVWRLIRTWFLVIAAQYFAFTDSPLRSFRLLFQSFFQWDFKKTGELMLAAMESGEWLIVGTALFIFGAVDLFCERKENLWKRLAEEKCWVRWPVLLGLILAISVFGIYGPDFDSRAFLYMQF